MVNTPSEHEKLFDEICGKLTELSRSIETPAAPRTYASKSFEKAQGESMQKNQRFNTEELSAAHAEFQQKIKAFDSLNVNSTDLNQEIKKITETLETERATNSKLSSDLAKSLELNLKLQFEIEEIRAKANSIVNEERKHNQFLSEKNKSISTELELAHALQNELKNELSKAKAKFQQETEQLFSHLKNLEKSHQESMQLNDAKSLQLEELTSQNSELETQLKNQAQHIDELENHTLKQNEILRELSSAAEKKMVELKLALDKKSLESQDYYGHLQQALTQVQVLRQENASLKDYIQKLTNLQTWSKNEQNQPTC